MSDDVGWIYVLMDPDTGKSHGVFASWTPPRQGADAITNVCMVSDRAEAAAIQRELQRRPERPYVPHPPLLPAYTGPAMDYSVAYGA